jgi:hypothetical protein
MLQHQRCTNDEDFAKFSLFFLQHKYDLHLSFSTLDTISFLYSYLTQGHLFMTLDSTGQVIGIAAYYHGTQDQEFKNKDIAVVDMAIFDRAYRVTRLFVRGLTYLVNSIIETHPEVQELHLVALSENAYLCKLYAKLTNLNYIRDGYLGKETVFCVKVHSLMGILKNFEKV